MAGLYDAARAAAAKRPSARTAEEQRLVDDNQGDLGTKNADFKAQKDEGIFGRSKS